VQPAVLFPYWLIIYSVAADHHRLVLASGVIIAEISMDKKLTAMSQVNFYILNNVSIEKFTCQLAEKIFKKGHKIHIFTANSQQTERLDQLLWTYDEQSFLPHVAATENNTHLQRETPVTISHHPEHALTSDVLINLRSEIPVFYPQFNRVAELVPADPQQRQTARMRYKQYQQQGNTVTSHEINR